MNLVWNNWYYNHKNLGINTSTVNNYETVGAQIHLGYSFDGSLVFNARLDNINGYYIETDEMH